MKKKHTKYHNNNNNNSNMERTRQQTAHKTLTITRSPETRTHAKDMHFDDFSCAIIRTYAIRPQRPCLMRTQF